LSWPTDQTWSMGEGMLSDNDRVIGAVKFPATASPRRHQIVRSER
jgi:hypothetical protein